MKYFFLLLFCFLCSCTTNTKREKEILEKLIENSFTDNWKTSKKNRANILKFDISPEPYLWKACNTGLPEELMYHLKTLELLGNFTPKKWNTHKAQFRQEALNNLKDESRKVRFDAITKLMIFGKFQDINALAPLIQDNSPSVKLRAKGALLQLGAPFRAELHSEKILTKKEEKKYVTFYLNWYKNNQNNNREDLLWAQLQKHTPAHHKQTIVNGLISMLSAMPEKKHFGSDVIWNVIQKEINTKVRNQEIVLLGVLKDPKYKEALLKTGWLSKGSYGSRLRVAWALNQMGYPNPQPYK